MLLIISSVKSESFSSYMPSQIIFHRQDPDDEIVLQVLGYLIAWRYSQQNHHGMLVFGCFLIKTHGTRGGTFLLITDDDEDNAQQ